MAAKSSKSSIDPFDLLRGYEERSLAHEPGRPELVEAPGHWRGVGFRIGKRRLLASFDDVIEILTLNQITPVPGSQSWLLGVTNARGSLFAVVDLKLFLEGERTVFHEGQRVLVVRQNGGNVALLIDELYGQRTFNDSHRVQSEAEPGRFGHFVHTSYQVGEVMWGVFDMSVLTRTPEFRQAAA